MKSFFPVLLVLLFACQPAPNENTNEISVGDTIQTASGLQYVYLKKGSGRRVSNGSFVNTKLSLQIDDSVIWTSYELEDSVFRFLVGSNSVIKGFEEMALLMREGDNVMAILPDSLAYGDKGSGEVVPPNSTLVYNRYEMVAVSQPKVNAADTLFQVFQEQGLKTFQQLFEIVNNDTMTYHSWDEDIHGLLLRKLRRDSLYDEMVSISIYLGERLNDADIYGGVVTAYYYQGKYEEALDSLNAIMNRYSNQIDTTEWNSSRRTFERLIKEN